MVEETKKAFRKLPNLEQALTALTNLKGVGITMASALLAAAAPDSAPFMADECLMAVPDIESIDYTTKEYLKFVQHIQTTVARLNSEKDNNIISIWTPHKYVFPLPNFADFGGCNSLWLIYSTLPFLVLNIILIRVELALWAHSVASQLKPELLDGIPTATIISSSTTVVETLKGENGDDSIIKTTTVTDDAESTADENSTDVVTDNESRVGGGEDDIDGELKETSTQITATETNNIANNTNSCSDSNSNTSIKQNHMNTDAKDETEDSTELTEQQPPVLNGNNTASSTTEQSDESNLEQPVQVIAANGNNKNGKKVHFYLLPPHSKSNLAHSKQSGSLTEVRKTY